MRGDRATARPTRIGIFAISSKSRTVSHRGAAAPGSVALTEYEKHLMVDVYLLS
ncbi:hypothetical protein GA0061098_106410 [Bradyrhizobium shewense]|uniref:Uncharacterized protein n=1 Tax=Bradyrhizobium shewense TaxID=1761772 RepID=A0A1C3XUU7_9BRAD|nr:hypothetical protein GA0061098_106410 [Bradyrhizobium shewense]